ncbi:CBO0543 family protein [Priestia megaterium]|uniref:CBO0543 family protein n=1 Tax=Priestia megaterium TaxID=1404 RepID=UPI001F50B291|nr:CBO0543 family protein [Priestia megaterium]
MGRKFEINLVKFLYFFGISSFIYLIKKPLAKEWLLVFFIKSYYASLVDNLVVKRGYVQYPTRFPKQVKTSVLFDYILFPITCVFYNQLTKDSRIIQCLLKVLYFSIPMTIAELWLEKIHVLLNIKMDGIGQLLFILSLFPYYWLDLQCLL